jgi:hypothetical protein
MKIKTSSSALADRRLIQIGCDAFSPCRELRDNVGWKRRGTFDYLCDSYEQLVHAERFFQKWHSGGNIRTCGN